MPSLSLSESDNYGSGTCAVSPVERQLNRDTEFDGEETKLHTAHVNLRKAHFLRTGGFYKFVIFRP